MDAVITTDSSYRLLAFRFMRMKADCPQNVLITGDTGEHLFITNAQLHDLLDKRLQRGTALYKDLLARHFIYEPGKHDPLPEMAAQLRSRKDFLLQGPALHLFVVTLRCNHTCQYCQFSRAPLAGDGHDLSEQDARDAVDRLFESTAPSLTVEFQGDEPLLAFDCITPNAGTAALCSYRQWSLKCAISKAWRVPRKAGAIQ